MNETSDHICPRCGFPGKDPRAVRAGAIGGRTTGPTKARSPEALARAVSASLAARRAKKLARLTGEIGAGTAETPARETI